MSLSNEQILTAISEMSIMQVVELIDMMEKKFGVTAAAPVAMVAQAGGAAEAAKVEEKTEFDVILKKFEDSKKVEVIKAVRAATSLGLKEAKALVESAPAAVKEAISKDEAAALKKALEEAGAEVEVK